MPSFIHVAAAGKLFMLSDNVGNVLAKLEAVVMVEFP
jgi:hypothetical protein